MASATLNGLLVAAGAIGAAHEPPRESHHAPPRRLVAAHLGAKLAARSRGRVQRLSASLGAGGICAEFCAESWIVTVEAVRWINLDVMLKLHDELPFHSERRLAKRSYPLDSCFEPMRQG